MARSAADINIITGSLLLFWSIVVGAFMQGYARAMARKPVRPGRKSS